MFNEDPKYNIQVQTPTSNSNLNQRPIQPAAAQLQNSFNGPTTHSKANEDNYDDDGTPVVIIDSRGYQAMSFALNLFKVS